MKGLQRYDSFHIAQYYANLEKKAIIEDTKRTLKELTKEKYLNKSKTNTNMGGGGTKIDIINSMDSIYQDKKDLIKEGEFQNLENNKRKRLNSFGYYLGGALPMEPVISYLKKYLPGM